MTKSNQKKTALYCRLSQDDGNQGDSNSIQNQDGICQGVFLRKHIAPPICYNDTSTFLQKGKEREHTSCSLSFLNK